MKAVRDNHRGMFCSLECYSKTRITSCEFPCGQCGSTVIRRIAEVRKSKSNRFFCSPVCSAKYNNYRRTIKSGLSSRSRAEDYVIELIKFSFPNLETVPNARLPFTNYMELDVWLPTINMAIELNGPMHYFPIHGDEKLAKIQNADFQKQLMLHNSGVRYFIVDISTLRSTNKKSMEFLKQHFEHVMLPVISALVE